MKPFYILILALLFTSCISNRFPLESKYEKVYTGMTIDDFLNRHNDVRNEYMNRETTIYSIRYYDDRNAKAFVSSSNEVTYKKFYYFENNKLVKVDMGERAVDFRLRIDN